MCRQVYLCLQRVFYTYKHEGNEFPRASLGLIVTVSLYVEFIILERLTWTIKTRQGLDPTAVQSSIGALQDLATWYRINYAGTQVTHWDFQNKRESGWSGTRSFVLEVPLCNARPSIIYSVPCDRDRAKGLL